MLLCELKKLPNFANINKTKRKETMDGFGEILTEEEVDNLFTTNGKEESHSTEEKPDKNDNNNTEIIDDPNKTEETIVEEEIDVDNLFGGKEKEKKEIDGNISEESNTTEENNEGIYNQFAVALKEENVFTEVDEDTLKKVKTPEDFKNLIETQISKGLDERQKRIDEALKLNVEPSQINSYENTLNSLNGITDDMIGKEGDDGEKLRTTLIYNDFVNRGFSKERAEREVKRSLDSGTDIEDAKDALQGNIDFYKKSYDDVIKQAKEKDLAEQQQEKTIAESLKKSILGDDKFFGELEVDKNTRNKIYDSISKPVYTDPSTGKKYTEIQKYQKENKTEFLKNIGLVYTMTDGFKNMNKLVHNKVQKEVTKGLKALENTINNTSRNKNGHVDYASNFKSKESRSSEILDIDI